VRRPGPPQESEAISGDGAFDGLERSDSVVARSHEESGVAAALSTALIALEETGRPLQVRLAAATLRLSCCSEVVRTRARRLHEEQRIQLNRETHGGRRDGRLVLLSKCEEPDLPACTQRYAGKRQAATDVWTLAQRIR